MDNKRNFAMLNIFSFLFMRTKQRDFQLIKRQSNIWSLNAPKYSWDFSRDMFGMTQKDHENSQLFCSFQR